MTKKKIVTIQELEKEYSKIAKTSSLYFGQYVKFKESQGYTIIYTNDELNEEISNE